MKYKFNGVKPLNKAILANNDLVGAGSWVEFAPGLSQAKLWQDAAGENAIETLEQDEMRVLPGFGVSANPDFSSQGNLLFWLMCTLTMLNFQPSKMNLISVPEITQLFRFPSLQLPVNVRFMGRKEP